MSEHTIRLHPTDVPDIPIRLHRFPPSGAFAAASPRKSVLLLHGASANHRTFLVNDGGLAAWLTARGYDVWTLDWRGSSLVVDPDAEALREEGLFTFNTAAAFDVPAAVERMVSEGVQLPIAALGHCMGGAVLAETIALGHLGPDVIDCVVLSTLGLFYEAPFDSRMKSEERVLEQLAHVTLDDRPFTAIDPRFDPDARRVRWPRELLDLYASWPGAAFHRLDPEADLADPRTRVADMCNRVAFMYGMPYHHGNLVGEIHGTDEGSGPTLHEQFGAIPLQMFLHASRNTRRRQATFFTPDRAKTDESFVSDAARRRFEHLSRVTLITGAFNRLWHRGSIDRMYDWLRNGSARGRGWAAKHILPDYGHQDLLWGARSADEVFPLIDAGLERDERGTRGAVVTVSGRDYLAS